MWGLYHTLRKYIVKKLKKKNKDVGNIITLEKKTIPNTYFMIHQTTEVTSDPIWSGSVQKCQLCNNCIGSLWCEMKITKVKKKLGMRTRENNINEDS